MQKVKLGDYVKIKTGKLDANASREDGKYPFFTCSQYPLKIDKYSYDCECVLVAGNGDLNVKYYNGKFDAYQRTYIIESKDDKIFVRYLYYFLDEYVETLRELSIGGVIKYIKLCNLTDVIFPMPSIEEQKAIAEKLDKVSRLIEKRKQQLSLLDTLVKSKFVEMFGDFDLCHIQSNWMKIGDLATVIGGSTPKTEKAEFWNGEYCWITPAELDDGSFIVMDTVRKITKEGVDSCSLRKLPAGTVLLSSRAPIGKVAIAGVEMYCNQGFKNLICSKFLNPIYVYYLLKFNVKYLNSLGRGATFKEISKTIVENILIPVSKIDLQNQFADFVKQTEKSKVKIKQSLVALELLKKSLMQKYFG